MTESLFDQQIHPVKQGLAFISLTIIVVGSVFLYQNGNVKYVDSTLTWELSLSILLMFALFNSVLSLPYKNQNDYWFYSTLAFILVAGVGAGLSYLATGLSGKQVMIFKWLYIVFTFGYLVFLSIVRAMRKIVQIAQKQDGRLRGEE